MIKRAIILPGVLILITLWGLLSLGFWQLDRADEKRAIESVIIKAQSQSAKSVSTGDLINKEHHQVLLKGRYDTDKQFIYDNQTKASNAGYYVLTPFILGDKNVVLVNRGFVPWFGNRAKLADIEVGNSQTTIKVKLIKPKQRIQLKKQGVGSGFPMLIQSLDLNQISQLSGYQIIPMLAQLEVGEKHGFYRNWQPFYGSVDKHLGYALQWFLMALVLLVIAIRLWIKNR